MTAPPRRLRELPELIGDASGQLAVEWVLLTATVVIPLVLLVPTMLAMIYTYFQRVVGVVGSPFP